MASEPREDEERVAGIVESAMRLTGIEPGPRIPHDVGGGLRRVDYRYPHAKPSSLALEVTSYPDEEYLAFRGAVEKMEQRLTTVAYSEGLGSWSAHLRECPRVKELEPFVARLMRESREQAPDAYKADDVQRPGQLDSVVSLARSDTCEEHEVDVICSSRLRGCAGFSGSLRDLVASNAQKLKEAQADERHLGVLVTSLKASADPGLTEVPSLPPAVDVLWVVHWRGGRRHGKAVWMASRGSDRWRLFPLEGLAGVKA